MTASLTDDEIEDRFFLLGRMEILNVLNDLIPRREPVMVYFNAGRDYFLTTLLEARPEALIFDLGGDLKANLRLVQSTGCVFVSSPDGIRVQFSGGQAHRFSWGGSDAFWVPLPERVIRLQRRESYRILLPVAKALMVRLVADDGHNFGEWPLHDLSVGGLCAAISGHPDLEPGQTIGSVRFALPNHRVVECSGIVRHATPVTDRHRVTRTRVGFAFSGLPRAMEVAIQRYVVKIEHERRQLLNK